MPNIRIILVTLLVVAILAYVSMLLAGAGLRMDAYEDLGQNMNKFTLYYMNGCPHCESILPAYKKFAAAGQFEVAGKKVAIRMLEQGDPAATEEIEAHNITGFPTFYLSTADGKELEYKGERSVEAMREFISKNAS
jgi:thiol-disulfide isomerase/thioredoxin